MSLKGKTLFITGASRGIGLAIALRAARDGANIAIAAKTETPHPKLEGTIYTAAEQIEKAGGHALPLVVDVRDEDAVKAGIDKTAEKFGGIDIVVNNASAVSRTPVAETDMKRYDLMQAHQHPRHLHGVEIRHPASGEGVEPAHPDELAAARHEGEVVRRHDRLFHRQIRHEPRGAGARRRTSRQGSPSTRCGRASPSPPRRSRTCSAATG